MNRPISILLLITFLVLTASHCRAQYVMQYVADAGYGLRFIDAHEGFAFGSNSIQHTTDGGYSWKVVSPDLAAATGCEGIYDCNFVNGTTGWLIAHTVSANPDSSFIYRTTDGGATWRRQRSSVISPIEWGSHRFTRLHFADERNGWVVGKGLIERTTDGGVTWTTQVQWPDRDRNNDWFTCCHFRNSNEGWVAGFGSLILHTTDGGINWEVQHEDSATSNGIILHVDRYYLHSIDFSDSLNGIAAANNGNYLYTHDGGRSWLPDSTRFPNDNVDVRLVSPGLIWQVGGNYCNNKGCFAGQSILYSTNGGKSWRSLKDTTIGLLGSGAQFHDIRFITPRLGYASNEWGEIFRIVDTSAAVAGVDEESEGGSQLGVFPNPVGEELRIELPASSSERSVNIYDMRGERVRSAVIGRAGHAAIGTSGLGAGIYIVEVVAPDALLRRRIVVVH